MVKVGVILESIMDSLNAILYSSTGELYFECVIHFSGVCEKHLNFLKYVESTILDHVKEKIVCAWTNQVRRFENSTTNINKYTHVTLKN